MNDTDYISIYEKRLQKAKPYAFLSMALLVVLMAGSITSATVFLKGLVPLDQFTHWTRIGLGAFLIPVLLIIIPLYKAHKCPKCNKFMGMKIGTHCNLCGTKIRNK